MKRVVWSALLIVLIEASPTDAVAQSFVCYAMTRGESATHAARRVTGNGQNAYQQWFQIMDPSSRFIPKSQYNRIGTGLRACVIKPAIRSVSSNANHVEEREAATVSAVPKGSEIAAVLPAPTRLARATAGVRSPRAASDSLRAVGGIDLTMLWLCAAMVVPWFGWQIVSDYLARRQTASIVVQCFVQRFVDEFERPLVRYDAGECPVRSRLRFGVRRGRFSILLAPGEGRVYPNLADHKKNVEYDVDRVMRVIADHSFVSGAPYTKAGWIVVPFQFTA
ncbi:MAG TPA: hypothetical protein VFP91_08735 [Vicinamibacterales bacterium]|nr:hypothetical protein [Vicinamibacterales bacterium]